MDQLLGINQRPPSSPTHYPLTSPDSVSNDLVRDMYLSFEDNACRLSHPFRIAWLSGVGTLPAEAGSPYTPAGDADVVIVDDNDVVVFDTTAGSNYSSSTYGLEDGLRAMTWVVGNQVCWVIVDNTLRDTTPSAFSPTSARIDARALNQLPARVTSLRVGGETLRGRITFSEGFNIRLTGETSGDANGDRNRSQILIRALPGDGLGRTDDCSDLQPVLRTINRVPPNANGDIYLDASDCFRIQRPGDLTKLDSPREFTPGGPEFVAELTEYLQAQDVSLFQGGAATAAAILNSDVGRSALQLHDDCFPCCSCDDFVSTYRGLTNIHANYQALATRISAVRDLYGDNVARWESQRLCREARNARLLLYNAYSCLAQIGGLFFNFTECCLRDIVVRLTLQVFDDSDNIVPSPTIGILRPSVFRAGPDTGFDDAPSQFTGTDTVLDTTYGFLDPGTGARIRAIVQIPACRNGWRIRVTLTAHVGAHTDSEGEPCQPDVTSTVPEDVRAMWSALPAAAPVRAWMQQDVGITPDNGFG